MYFLFQHHVDCSVLPCLGSWVWHWLSTIQISGNDPIDELHEDHMLVIYAPKNKRETKQLDLQIFKLGKQCQKPLVRRWWTFSRRIYEEEHNKLRNGLWCHGLI